MARLVNFWLLVWFCLNSEVEEYIFNGAIHKIDSAHLFLLEETLVTVLFI